MDTKRQRPLDIFQDTRMKRIIGALKSTINDHGPVTKDLITSAAKRIYGNLWDHDDFENAGRHVESDAGSSFSEAGVNQPGTDRPGRIEIAWCDGCGKVPHDCSG